MNRLIILSICFGLVAFGFLGQVLPVEAQSNALPPPGVNDQVSASIIPAVPGPNTETQIFIESFSTNLNKAYIVWQENGVTKLEGAGKTTYTFFTKGLGTKTIVKASISGEDGRYLTRSFTFEPAEVSLVSEALTYTPPFYRGKALFVPQASVKVVAFPEFILTSGAKVLPANLVYTWKKDNKVLQSDSGFGKQTLIIEGATLPRPMNITVEVSAVGSTLKAVSSITLTPEAPEIILYEDHLVYGTLWNRAIGQNLFLTKNEIKILAEPYFVSAYNTHDPLLSYSWRINGTPIANKPAGENSLGLRNESGEDGSSQISLTVDRKQKILQSAVSNLFIDFTKTQ